ncbi:PH domain-containing protein [Promicromonospora umidemergens]|uniref:YdbS-like PH domain-containing protein n=1 Tax=Promicromonospora umidemergens TaxID=629679 RepID=A0ABP8XTF1_9MICO|nr:PH domain-containing protein [Promicromonospora umidemergens]MCP2285220.1 PH domain-containing protein [Promicromonospora umidemergens]
MSATADFVVPNRALQRYILANEKIIIATHRHWGMLWEPILTAAAAFVLAMALLVAVDANVRNDMGWVWLPFAVLGGRLLYKWLEWRARWFVMTDRRLLLLDGFLVHRVAMMPSEKVTDLGYERTPLGQLLGYGTFLFETAGQDQALDRVTWVPRPDSRYRLIIASLFHPDAADAEAAAQANPDIRPEASLSADASSALSPPSLMPRIGRRSNPPTQRIELPTARSGADPDSMAEESTAKDTTIPASTDPTGVTWSGTGSGTHDEHVPGGPTADPNASEVRPEPFIEGGKDPKIR